MDKVVFHSTNYISEINKVSKNLFLLKRKHFWHESKIIRESFADGWKLFILEKTNLPIKIRSNESVFLGTKMSAIFLPPYEIIEWHIPKGYLEWTAYLSPIPLLVNYSQAIAFDWNQQKNPKNINDIEKILLNLKKFKIISLEDNGCSVAKNTKEFISKNFSKNLSMKDIALELQIPYSTMTHYFKRAYFISPSEYRQQLRVTHAGQLIVKDKKNTLDSCFESGHGDYSNFKEAFKKIFGATPKEFKEVQL
ncbi:MAG: helix-turn-helix transcriptional regulator [Bdellovibrionales bacterium]|nr:helix-turn-helix transcriptional regulator [Bdellovibrionales bacterium]